MCHAYIQKSDASENTLTEFCGLLLQIAALMRDKAVLEARVTQAAATPAAKTFKQIETLPKYCCKACG